MGDAQDRQQEQDSRFMRKALALASRGAGRVSPNPLVGCVIVKDGEIVGRGWHEGPGLPHAEIAALKDAGDKARDAVAYVTLEPCNHTGRTGPCVDALLDAGVQQVVYALADPNPAAAGGAKRLREAGIETKSGVLETEARYQNRFWLCWLETNRPYVVAKFAASLDGKLATHTGDSQWITGPASRARAHELRRQVDAVIIGADTVIADDPSLTARPDKADPQYPLRVVLDSGGRTPPGAKVYDRAGRGALLVASEKTPSARLDSYRKHGAEILALPAGENGRPDLDALLGSLGARGINGVMVEGGGVVLGSFFDAGLVDEVWAFIAPLVIGGRDAPSVAGLGPARLADARRLAEPQTELLDGDILVRGRIAREAT